MFDCFLSCSCLSTTVLIQGKSCDCASPTLRSNVTLPTSIPPALRATNNLVSLTPESKRRATSYFARPCQLQSEGLAASKPRADSSKTTTIIVIQFKFSFNSAELAIHHGARHAPCVTNPHWPYFDHRVSIAEHTTVNAA